MGGSTPTRLTEPDSTDSEKPPGIFFTVNAAVILTAPVGIQFWCIQLSISELKIIG